MYIATRRTRLEAHEAGFLVPIKPSFLLGNFGWAGWPDSPWNKRSPLPLKYYPYEKCKKVIENKSKSYQTQHLENPIKITNRRV